MFCFQIRLRTQTRFHEQKPVKAGRRWKQSTGYTLLAKIGNNNAWWNTLLLSTQFVGLPNHMIYQILWSTQSYGLPNPMVCPIQLEIARFVMKTEWKWGNPSRVNIQRSPTAIKIFGQHVQCQWCSLLFGATIAATDLKARITSAKIQNPKYVMF